MRRTSLLKSKHNCFDFLFILYKINKNNFKNIFLQKIQNIIDLIDKAIKDEPELLLTGGWIVKDWFDEKVDEYRDILQNSKDWLADYQAELAEKTWISNLKIKFTNVSGYFIEIPKSQVSKINDDFIQKQTLVNASRYITSDLKKFEEDFRKAENSVASREYDLFLEIRAEILDSYREIKDLSDSTAFLDFNVSMSNIAYLNNYARPKITKNYDLKILNWRHVVVEQIEKDFISNNLELKSSDFVHIITGPNMWGKSTFLRQNALIILMSHIWSFVPARIAEIPLTDKIFSRVGASDNLYFGQSTFMVEMQEVANIMNNSTKKSFIIIDEVGRWTSTFDWMSLAWAILKENHDKIKAKTLFATHYHELIDEAKTLSGVKNFSVAVWENNENLVFLRKIIPGGIKKSFGLEVAKLAWINNSILDEAKKMLINLENKEFSNSQLSFWNITTKIEEKIVIKEIEKKSEIEEDIKKIDLNNLTPIEALNLVNKLKQKI